MTGRAIGRQTARLPRRTRRQKNVFGALPDAKIFRTATIQKPQSSREMVSKRQSSGTGQSHRSPHKAAIRCKPTGRLAWAAHGVNHRPWVFLLSGASRAISRRIACGVQRRAAGVSGGLGSLRRGAVLFEWPERDDRAGSRLVAAHRGCLSMDQHAHAKCEIPQQ